MFFFFNKTCVEVENPLKAKSRPDLSDFPGYFPGYEFRPHMHALSISFMTIVIGIFS